MTDGWERAGVKYYNTPGHVALGNNWSHEGPHLYQAKTGSLVKTIGNHDWAVSTYADVDFAYKYEGLENPYKTTGAKYIWYTIAAAGVLILVLKH